MKALRAIAPAGCRSRCILTAVLNVLCVSAALSSSTFAADRWALLIGVDKCRAVGELKVCSNDARALKGTLERVGYPSHHIRLLVDDAPDPISWPSFATVRRSVEDIAEAADKNDTILVFFSGHGVTRNNEGFLIPVDGDVNNAVSLSWVKEQLNKSRATQKILILDACHAGAAKSVNGIAPSLATSPGVTMLLSCEADQLSWPDEATGHSVFTRYLLEGLGGKVESAERKVSAEALAQFVQKRVVEWTFVNQKPIQRPLLVGRASADVVLAEYPEGGVAVRKQEETTVLAEYLEEQTLAPEGMVYVPPGTFTFGLSAKRAAQLVDRYGVPSLMVPEWFGPQQPEQNVSLEGFYIDRTEVTNAEYKKFIDATGRAAPPAPDWVGNKVKPGFENNPVTNVSWQEAADYAKWAGKRLPTEKEWEKAARGLDGRLFPWGETFDPACSVVATEGVKDGTHPVGSIPQGRSPFGCDDMIGNVMEWTADNYEAYEGNQIQERLLFVDKSHKVARGCGYNESLAFSCLATWRFTLPPETRDPALGFRCATDVE